MEEKGVEIRVEDDRTGMSPEAFSRAFIDNLLYMRGQDRTTASAYDCYCALAYTMRDRLMHRWIKSRQTHFNNRSKFVFYFSAEFLLGRHMHNALLNAGCWRQARQTLAEFDLDTYEIFEQEPEPGLGNGGLGRLAACFLDSLATLDIPAIGHGIRYEFGIFEQRIENGWQIEHPDKWLRWGNPWEISRPQLTVEVKFGGRVEPYTDENGVRRAYWFPDLTVLGTPYDTIIPGFKTENVATLRLWRAGTSKDFDLQIFNAGDYFQAVQDKTFSENISKVLYPNDNTVQGRELRLRQQFFFVSCALQDILRVYTAWHMSDMSKLHEYAAIQLNDTHPAIAIAELMRLLIDEHGVAWDLAWDVTQKCFGYTNHTLLSEALEKWPVSMFERLLPRHLQIIYEINHRFLSFVRMRFPNDEERLSRVSIIEEGEEKQVRMAHLATIGSHAINGVAALHSELVKHELLKDFYELWPERFSNKTNGVTPRRWLMLSNPKLTFLITEKIGKDWLSDLTELRKLEKFIDDKAFVDTWRIFKTENKKELSSYIAGMNGIDVNCNSLFDIQVKRIHEYKRQLLNVLYIITLYNRLKNNPKLKIQPRTFIFGGKAAPGYHMAKLIIKLINSVGSVVNNDPDVAGRIKVVFLENYCVSLGEKVYPAADLSEQISLAGKEASGTGNMKFALNGALTIGTLDGANIEIREQVGAENFFLFGMTVEQVKELKSKGYDPKGYYYSNNELRGVIDRIASGHFAQGDRGLFQPIVESLLQRDEYMLFADYKAYVDCQECVSETYADRDKWTKMSILNVARMGYFSSDRTIREYCEDIWKVSPVRIPSDEEMQALKAKEKEEKEKR